MTKKLIAFDLDDTLATTKSPIADRMAELLARLPEKYEICIISGGKFEQFTLQVTDRLKISAELLGRFHMMPACGTRYYRYDILKEEWALQYAEDLTKQERDEIIGVLEDEASRIDLKNAQTWGSIVEDRKSQIAYSILGQQAPPEEKYKWVEHNLELKKDFHGKVSARLPGFEVRLGGTTTIDVTRLGVDKAYGMKKLMAELQISKDEILFIGDKLEEGGNDYPVKAMGITSIAVEKWQETALVIETLLSL